MSSQDTDKVTKIIIQDRGIHQAEPVSITQREDIPNYSQDPSVTKIPLDNIIKK